MKQLSSNLMAQLVNAGCPEARVNQCATLVSQAIVECLKVYRAKSKPPRKRVVLQRLGALRKALVALRGDPDGEMAFSVLQTVPEWSEVSVEDKLAEVDRALQTTERMMRKSPGAPTGFRDSPGCEWLFMRLWLLGRSHKLNWSAYKDRETSEAAGTFVEFIRALEKEWPFPKGFVPTSDATLLNGLHRAKMKLT